MQDRYQLFETIERLTGKTLLESELDEICRVFYDKTPIKKEYELGKIYAAPISSDWYAVFVGDQKLTLPLSEADAKKIVDRYNGFEELQQANKALSLQNEVLSGAYETSQRRVKELEAKIERIQAEQAEMLQLINAMLAAEKESNGICDCIDNSGVSYQSAFLAGVLSQMEIIASKNKSAQS